MEWDWSTTVCLKKSVLGNTFKSNGFLAWTNTTCLSGDSSTPASECSQEPIGMNLSVLKTMRFSYRQAGHCGKLAGVLWWFQRLTMRTQPNRYSCTRKLGISYKWHLPWWAWSSSCRRTYIALSPFHFAVAILHSRRGHASQADLQTYTRNRIRSYLGCNPGLKSKGYRTYTKTTPPWVELSAYFGQFLCIRPEERFSGSTSAQGDFATADIWDSQRRGHAGLKSEKNVRLI